MIKRGQFLGQIDELGGLYWHINPEHDRDLIFQILIRPYVFSAGYEVGLDGFFRKFYMDFRSPQYTIDLRLSSTIPTLRAIEIHIKFHSSIEDPEQFAKSQYRVLRKAWAWEKALWNIKYYIRDVFFQSEVDAVRICKVFDMSQYRRSADRYIVFAENLAEAKLTIRCVNERPGNLFGDTFKDVILDLKTE